MNLESNLVGDDGPDQAQLRPRMALVASGVGSVVALGLLVGLWAACTLPMRGGSGPSSHVVSPRREEVVALPRYEEVVASHQTLYHLPSHPCDADDDRRSSVIESLLLAATAPDDVSGILEGWVQESTREIYDPTPEFGLTKDGRAGAKISRNEYQDNVRNRQFYCLIDDVQSACRANKADSCAVLAIMYRAGLGVTKNETNAWVIEQRLCEASDPTSCVRLGSAYAERTPEASGAEPRIGIAMLERSCDRGHALSCDRLGQLVGEGRGAPKSTERAAALFQKAASLVAAICSQPASKDCIETASYYANPANSALPRDRATFLFSRTCDGGSGEGCSRLGDIVAPERPSPAEDKEARALYERSCDLGYHPGCTSVGTYFEQGRGGPRDAGRAREVYRKACDLGSAEGCRNLGGMHYRGTGGSRDLAQAVQLYGLACERKPSEACNSAGWIQFGLGNDEDAVKFYRRGCAGRDGMACYNLGLFYWKANRNGLQAFNNLSESCTLGYAPGCVGARLVDLASNGATSAHMLAEKDKAAAHRLCLDEHEGETCALMGLLTFPPYLAMGKRLLTEACEAKDDRGECRVRDWLMPRSLPSVLILLDHSGPMVGNMICQTRECNARWTNLVNPLGRVLHGTQDRINYGLSIFPEHSLCAVGDSPTVPLASDNADAIGVTLTGLPKASKGLKPTRVAVKRGAAYLSSLPDYNPKFMVLITDGVPTCSETGGATDESATVQAVRDATASGVQVFVVGVAIDDAAKAATLTAMAEAGGRPRSDVKDPTRKYYPVDSFNDMLATMNAIVGQIAPGHTPEAARSGHP